MKLSLNWIKDFVEIPTDKTPKELGHLLTLHTAEVEDVTVQKDAFELMYLGQIKKIEKHPDADKLKVCHVDLGSANPNGELAQIVCGGSNVEEGMKVAVAIPGATVAWHGCDIMTLKKAKIRGVESYGMICAGEEIGLGEMQESYTKDSEAILPLNDIEAAPGTLLADALNLDDIIFDIDNKSLTHRPDLWGHYGMAREWSTIFRKPLKPISELFTEASFGKETELKVSIEDNEMCPLFSGCVITGVEVKESPDWVKRRLESAGMNAINNIVDITNYVMLELGQPMHAYDRKQVGSDELTIGPGKEGVTLVTLDETEQELTFEDPVIYNGKGEPLILAGIKGGLKSGIHENTTEIILEAANWDPVMIRKASVRHQLRTDASQRFEKSLDPANTELAIQRAITLILESCPDAKVISPITTEGVWKNPELKLQTTVERVNSKIGKEIPEEEMLSILKWLEFKTEKKGDEIHVDVPTWRATRDVDIEEDIVEEIARIHGYDQIVGEVPALPIKLPVQNMERVYKHQARRILAYQQGFTEVMNYSFYSKERFTACGLEEEEHVKVLNYLSEDQTHMRVSLAPNMLAAIAKNAREFPELRLFEIGRTYKEVGKYMPLEEKVINAAISAQKPKGNWQESELFYQAKGELEFFLKQFRTGKYKLQASKEPLPYAHPKKSLDVIVRGKHVGHIFTVHPGVLKAYDIEHDVAMFSLKFNQLVAHGRGLQDFNEPTKFPGMEFDVSVLVEEKTEVEKLEKVMMKADKQKLITQITLGDLYMGANIPQGKKSLLFTIKLQDPNGTLNDQQFKELQESVFLALEAEGAKIRGRE